MIFDDWLKKNFDAVWLWKRPENQALRQLRGQVTARIRSESSLARFELRDGLANDVVLYEILGGIDPTPTGAYVDRAKSIGITAVSLALVVVYVALYLVKSESGWLALLALLAFIWFWGRQIIENEDST